MSYTSTVLADSPSSYWPLNDAGSPCVDSVAGFNATVTDAPLFQQTAIINEGSSMFFDGVTSQQLDIGNHYGAGGTASMSIEAWCQPRTVSASSRTVANKASATDGWWLKFTNAANGNIAFRRTVASVNVDTSSTTTPVPGVIYHVVATYDGTNSRIYVNGVLETTGVTDTASITDGTDPFRIERQSLGGSPWDGYLQAVAFYNAAVLSGTQVLAHYNAGVLTQPPVPTLFVTRSNLRMGG